jgi:hypothetical protein
MRSILGDQAPLGDVPQVLPCETPTKRNDPRVVGGADIQMHEGAAEQYLAYKLIDSNQDWKSKWFYITNHHPELPKLSGKQPKHQPW